MAVVEVGREAKVGGRVVMWVEIMHRKTENNKQFGNLPSAKLFDWYS